MGLTAQQHGRGAQMVPAGEPQAARGPWGRAGLARPLAPSLILF